MCHRIGWCLFAFALLVLPHSRPSSAGFLPFASYTTGLPAKSAAFVTYSGSRRPDLAFSAYSSGTGSVGTMGNNGAGAFAPWLEIAPLPGVTAMAVHDFNNDGFNDLAALDTGDHSVHILLASGDGTFSPGAVTAVGTGPAGITAADLNGDGNQDLAVVSGGTGAPLLQILLGTGSGTFSAPTAVPLGDGCDPQGVIAADLTSDSAPDLAVACRGTGTVSLLAGDGTGGFPARSDHPTGPAPVALAAGDFNADGTADLAVATSGTATIDLLLGTGGGLGQAARYQAGSRPTGVVVGDFNRDGTPDLAVTLGDDSSIAILAGRGDGTFLVPEAFPAGSAPASPATADVDGDGTPDLVATSGSASLSLLLNSSPPAAGISVSPPAYDFGGVLIGMTIPGPTRDFVIANRGSSDLAVAGMALSGADSGSFDLYPGGPAPCPGLSPTIAPGGSCTVTAKFVPFSAGSKTAAIDIASSALATPGLSVQLRGTGEYPRETLYVQLSGSTGSVDLSTGDSCGSFCQFQIQRYTPVQLTPRPAADSRFTGWNGCDSVDGGICTATIGLSSRWVTATFATGQLPVRITGTVPTYFTSITGAYAASRSGDTLQAAVTGSYAESPLLGRDIAVTLAGGVDASFGQTGGPTTIHGSLTISGGTVTIDGIAVM